MDAKKIIEGLPHEGAKKFIFKKGLVNLLPQPVSSVLKNNYQAFGSDKIDLIKDDSNLSTNTEDPRNLAKEVTFTLESAEELSNIEERKAKTPRVFRKPRRPAKSALISYPKIQAKQVSEVIKVKDDVNDKIKIELDNLGFQDFIEIEEESVETITTKKDESPKLVEESFTFNIIPISSSANFNKSNNHLEGRSSYFDLLNLETKVINSNRPELIGTQRTILNHQQLASLGCLVMPESNRSNPQLNAIVNPNNIAEDDVFWDNFYIFKKREEEKKKVQENDSDDSDSSDSSPLPLKIGKLEISLHLKFR